MEVGFEPQRQQGSFRDAVRLIRCPMGGHLQTSHLSDEDPTGRMASGLCGL